MSINIASYDLRTGMYTTTDGQTGFFDPQGSDAYVVNGKEYRFIGSQGSASGTLQNGDGSFIDTSGTYNSGPSNVPGPPNGGSNGGGTNNNGNNNGNGGTTTPTDYSTNGFNLPWFPATWSAAPGHPGIYQNLGQQIQTSVYPRPTPDPNEFQRFQFSRGGPNDQTTWAGWGKAPPGYPLPGAGNTPGFTGDAPFGFNTTGGQGGGLLGAAGTTPQTPNVPTPTTPPPNQSADQGLLAMHNGGPPVLTTPTTTGADPLPQQGGGLLAPPGTATGADWWSSHNFFNPTEPWMQAYNSLTDPNARMGLLTAKVQGGGAGRAGNSGGTGAFYQSLANQFGLGYGTDENGALRNQLVAYANKAGNNATISGNVLKLGNGQTYTLPVSLTGKFGTPTGWAAPPT